MSEQQNPQEVLQSLQQPTGFGADNGQSDSKPFSIRQYVLASRQKDIFHSWPFPEKYLQIFLSRGINTVLPPFESHHSALQSLRGRPIRSNSSQKIKENVAASGQTIHESSALDKEKVSKPECDLSKSNEIASEICSQDCETHKLEDQNDCRIDVSPCNGAMSSAKRLKVKRKWGKGKHYKKKKSIINILDAAKTRSSENVPRINRLRRGLSKTLEYGVKESKEMTNGEHNCESELTEDQCLKNKLDMSRTKRWVIKYELRNCSSRNSQNTIQGGKGKKALRNGLRQR